MHVRAELKRNEAVINLIKIDRKWKYKVFGKSIDQENIQRGARLNLN